MDQDVFLQTMNAALKLHQASELAQAEMLYRQALAQFPEHPDALHLLGVIALQCGRADAAAELIGRAIARLPDQSEYHNHYAEAFRDLGQINDAIREFQTAIGLKPDFAEPHFKLADLYQ